MAKIIQLPSYELTITSGMTPQAFPASNILTLDPDGDVTYVVWNRSGERVYLVRSDGNLFSAVFIDDDEVVEVGPFDDKYSPYAALVQQSTLTFDGVVGDPAPDGDYVFELVDDNGDGQEVLVTASSNTFGEVLDLLDAEVDSVVTASGGTLEATAVVVGSTLVVSPGGSRLFVGIQNLDSPSDVVTLSHNSGSLIVTPSYVSPER